MNVMEAVEPMLGVGLPVLAMPNAGLPRRIDERLVYVSTPEYFGLHARRMFKLGVKLVGGWDFADHATVTVHVRRLREKIEADPHQPTRVVTVFGVGYRYEPSDG